jgi:PEP-CTERM motif
MKKFALAVAALAALAASAAQAAISYSGSVTGTNVFTNAAGTASYTITTDGTFGTLSASNFVGYTLSINGINSSGAGIFNLNDGFGAASATATALSFDFSLINRTLIFYNGNSYLCFNTSGITCVGEPTPAVAFGNFSDNTVGSYDPRSGVQVIATSGAVPEPASWAMLIAGFGLTGAAMRRRKAVVAA